MSIYSKPDYKPFPLELLDQRKDDFYIYTGECHCGRIKFQVNFSPRFPEHEVASCNCSICRRNGYLLVYPLREDVITLRGGDEASEYTFNQHKATHKFCPACGSSIWVDFNNHEAKDVVGINVSSSSPGFSIVWLKCLLF
jgi:hypothetical protein